MESTGTYQAGDTADESATPEKVVPLRRGFYMTDNAYVDELMHDLSGAAWKCLTFIIRQTCGYHVPQASISLATFRDGIKRADGTVVTKGTGLSSPAIIEALDDLQRAHIITRTDDGRRTTVPSYALRPQEEWTPDALLAPKTRRTCKKILQVDDASKKTLQASPETMQKILQVEPSSLSENLTYKIQGEINTKRGKKTETDANASADAQARSATSEKPTRKKPKLSPEARERHNAEAAYVSDLRKRILAHLRYNGKPPKEGEDRAGGHWFYTAGPNKTPADPEQVLALYVVVKQSPHYGGQYLTLQAIVRYWPDWQIDPERVKESIAVEQRKAHYARNAANSRNGRVSSTPPPSPDIETETDTPLARNAQATRERLARIRREREAAEAAAAKGAQS